MTAGLLRPSPDGAVRASLIGSTPIVEIGVELPGITGEVRTQPVYLKIEAANPFGSIKDRTAYALVRSLELRGELAPGSRIIESTSGNLGVALAAIAAERGYRFVAVVDPKISGPTLGRLQDLGADVEMVGEADTTGNYLLARLARVRQLREQHRELAWTDQYRNPANPRAHFERTGPELLRQCGGRLGTVFVAVSTGGTLAGIGRYLRAVSPATSVVAVDVPGSRAVGCSFGTRLLNGIGSSQRSAFLVPGLYDRVELVPDPEAITTCHAAAQAGVSIGGSSGAALAAAIRWLRAGHENPARRSGPVAVVCPDGAENYLDTLFDPAWLEHRGIDLTCVKPPLLTRKASLA